LQCCFPFRSTLTAHITLTLRHEGLFFTFRADCAANPVCGSSCEAQSMLLFRRYSLPIAYLSNSRTKPSSIAFKPRKSC
jgi:hypothetical protein